jgi:hypothetical protein
MSEFFWNVNGNENGNDVEIHWELRNWGWRFHIDTIIDVDVDTGVDVDVKRWSYFTSELIADEGFSMLSKGLPDLAQALETSLLISY